MGAFHCPVGAAYYDDEACIDCGMCLSTTAEEKASASEKIRAHLRSRARPAARAGKIAVCGKGGAGKTTFVALLAAALSRSGLVAVVVDADESNPGLFRMLGLLNQPEPLAGHIAELEGACPRAEAGSSAAPQLNVEDIPSAYVSSGPGVRFMSVGKITDPFQGCACSLAEVAGEVVEMLCLQDNEVLVLDTEAGVESFGRGLERHVDTVLAVVEPSYESITLAVKIVSMARGMGISRTGVVLNKMGSAAVTDRVRRDLEGQGVKVFGTVSRSDELAEEALEGSAVASRSAVDEARAVYACLSEA